MSFIIDINDLRLLPHGIINEEDRSRLLTFAFHTSFYFPESEPIDLPVAIPGGWIRYATNSFLGQRDSYKLGEPLAASIDMLTRLKNSLSTINPESLSMSSVSALEAVRMQFLWRTGRL